MNVKPLYDRIVVKRDAAQAETAGGIALPQKYIEKPRRGTVIAVGDGYHSKESGEFIPLALKPGDRVIFGQYAGTEIEVDGEKLTIMRESDIVATVTGDGDVQAGADMPRRDAVHPFYQ